MSTFPFPELPPESAENANVHEQYLLGTNTDTNFLIPPVSHHATSSPDLNNIDTPSESVAVSLHYQSSDFSDPDADAGDDSYFNFLNVDCVNGPSFLVEDPAVDSLDASGPLVAATTFDCTTPELTFALPAVYPMSPDKTPSLNPPATPDHRAATFSSSAATTHNHTAHAFAPIPPCDGLVSPHQATKASPSPLTATPLFLTQAFAVAGSSDATQLAPDTTSSGGSLGHHDRSSLSTEGGAATATTVPPMSSQNPHVTVSFWSKDKHQEEYHVPSDIKTEHAVFSRDDGYQPPLRPASSSHSTYRGIDPPNRTTEELPTSANEDAAARKIELQNVSVSQWLNKTSNGDPYIAASMPGKQNDTVFEGVSDREIGSGTDTENVAQSGRTYYADRGGLVTDTDYEIMMQSSSIWNDRPSVLTIKSNTKQQPETSQAAIERFEKQCQDTASILSRAATWGTRRRSAPSIADVDGITSGNFLKKLSISRGDRRPSILDGWRTLVGKPSTSQPKRPREGPSDDDATSFDDLLPGENRRGSTSGNALGASLRNQECGKSKQSTPSVNAMLVNISSEWASIGNTHTRNGSVSGPAAGSVSVSPPLTSPKSPLLKVSNPLRRPRSRSDTKGMPDSSYSSIVDMLKRGGGPPVPKLPTANAVFTIHGSVPGPAPVPLPSPSIFSTVVTQAPTPIQIPATNIAVADPDDNDDDDDDDALDDSDLKVDSDELIDTITPDLNGFRSLVVGLNPMLAESNTYLVDRIAHQQIVRYKALLNNKVKHLGQVKDHTCPSGERCVAQGGSSVAYNNNGAPRSMDRLSATTDGEGMDGIVSPLEGAISADSFPKYIPMPPVTVLPAEFECQLCFQNKSFKKPSDWTKHVHEDVQPFTCTWDRCRDPKIFKRKADWVRHENEGHRHLEWWMCNVEECRHKCYRRDNFLQHLVREHKFEEPKHKTKASIKRAKMPDPTWQRVEQCRYATKTLPEEEPCRFCGKTFPKWKKLTVHLAKHMENISLPILRLVERKEVEADTLISPVQDPPPRTFAPPMPYDTVASTYPNDMPFMSLNIPATGAPTQNTGLNQFGHPLSGYGGTRVMQDPSGVMFPAGTTGASGGGGGDGTTPVTQVPYSQTAYFGQQPLGAGMGVPSSHPSHMQGLAATAVMPGQTSFGGVQGYSGQLPGTAGSYPASTNANHCMMGPVGISAPQYGSGFNSANALGLQDPITDEQLRFNTPSMMAPSASGSDQFASHPPVSPFTPSPLQSQGPFYGP